MDALDTIMDYEQGALSDNEVVELFQALIDSGAAILQQDHYGRMAEGLIWAGNCHR